jgi:ubiquinone/menaquinone biosynthesis C-methylase UbiE
MPKDWDWTSEARNAQRYETDLVPTLFAPWAPQVADAAQIRAGDRVLDVGCGTGVLARLALARAGTQGAVTGVDVNEGMLAVAQRAEPSIEWAKGDAMALPFAGASFDAVVSQFALMFISDPTTAVSEMRRVLAPGGRLALAVWGPFEMATGYAALAEPLKRYGGQSAVDVLTAPHVLGDVEKLRFIFTSAGFEQPAVTMCMGGYTQPSIAKLLEFEVKNTPLKERFTDESYAEFAAEAETALQPFLLPNGEVSIPLAAAIVTAQNAG